MKRVKILIGVLSCHRHSDRRRACFETWADVGGRDGLDLVFIVGGGLKPWACRQGWLLHCPCPDDRDSLSLKVRHFCGWAVEHFAFEYLFKCDDDTYVHVGRLLQYEPSHEYVGNPIPNRPGYVHPNGGGGYLLGRKAAERVAATGVYPVSYEDWLVWRMLKNAGIPLRSDPRFRFNHDRAPTAENDLITCHWCGPDRMREIHRGLLDGTPQMHQQVIGD